MHVIDYRLGQTFYLQSTSYNNSFFYLYIWIHRTIYSFIKVVFVSIYILNGKTSKMLTNGKKVICIVIFSKFFSFFIQQDIRQQCRKWNKMQWKRSLKTGIVELNTNKWTSWNWIWRIEIMSLLFSKQKTFYPPQ